VKSKESLAHARTVLELEADCIRDLIGKLNSSFSRAVDIICSAKGRVIVTGIGKSGIIGKKIVATLTSTGTPALFLHPVEGLHGDLGIVTKDDVVLAISNSGETKELNMIVACVKEAGIPFITMTGNTHSSLARESTIIIDVGVSREACPFDLAPTSSTTATLAMGDALAVALLKRKNFTERDFLRFHPGGHLGERLMVRVKSIMLTGDDIPHIPSSRAASEALQILDARNLGFVLVTDDTDHLLGIITDGDVRRAVRHDRDLSVMTADDLMTPSPITIDRDASLSEAIEMMQKKEITALAVIDEAGHLTGCVHLHDILGRGGTIKISGSLA